MTKLLQKMKRHAKRVIPAVHWRRCQNIYQYIRRSIFFRNKWKRISYSQTGEDLILEFLIESLDISPVTYLDLGANHPVCLSNTCKLSHRGGVGVLVEPNIELCKVIKKFRKKDVCLNAGVGISETETMKDYYVMSSDVLNTFSKEEAERVASYGTFSICKVMPVPLFTFNQILSKYFPNQAPTVVSLDIEGLELEILQSADLEKYRPMIFCIETLEYNEKEPGKKNEALISYMQSKGYFVYADTYINTIFVDVARFKSRFLELRKAKKVEHEKIRNYGA